jgi:hypothetical protein
LIKAKFPPKNHQEWQFLTILGLVLAIKTDPNSRQTLDECDANYHKCTDLRHDGQHKVRIEKSEEKKKKKKEEKSRVVIEKSYLQESKYHSSILIKKINKIEVRNE